MGETMQCECSKANEIDRIQKDIRGINKNYIDVYAILTNGLSTEFPLLRAAVDKLATRMRTIEKALPEKHPESNKRPKMPRIVGTITIVAVFAFVCMAVTFLGIWVGIIDLEDIGKLIGAILERT